MMMHEPESSSRHTVAIVEDQREIREGLAQLIESSEFECVGAWGSMEEALTRLEQRKSPDLMLIDIGLPGMSGIDGIRILRETSPQTLLLTLTVYDDDERIVESICAGANGYLLKNTPADRLLASLRDGLAGGAPMSPEIARRVMTLFRESPPPKKVDYDLTQHESRLLRMLVEGHNYKTAAAELGISVNTVSFHMRSIYEKLQVHSKSEAVSKALRQRIV